MAPEPSPRHQVERERIRQFIPTIPEFKNLSATRIAEIEAAVKHQRFFMGDFICAEGEFLNSLMFIM
ncbi:hypothetical protein T484DRAFT_1769521 [Baffinella frigidus]|nr:hypothetical protein T484DRAFT_1769521 [Cryptophyta sp. CCMP2293]